VDDVHEPGIAGTEAAVGAVALEEGQGRIKGRYPGQLDAPLLQLLAGETGHLGAQAEANQVDVLRRIALVHQESQEPGQVAGRHRQILHGIRVPGHRRHRTPVDEDDIVVAPPQECCRGKWSGSVFGAGAGSPHSPSLSSWLLCRSPVADSEKPCR